MGRRIAMVALCVLLSGCYTFTPVTGTEVAQGTPVRARLAPPQEVELRDISVRSVVELDGEVVSMNRDEAVLSAFWVVTEAGFERTGQSATVYLDPDNIQQLQERRFDYWRTGGLIGAGIAGAFFLFDAVFDSGSGTEGGGGGGGQPL